jgi:predicted transcriptional regulator
MTRLFTEKNITLKLYQLALRLRTMKRAHSVSDVIGPLSKRVGAELREIRESAGLTQIELAKRLGVSQAALSRADMLISTIRDYLAALGASWQITASISTRIWAISAFRGQEDQFTSGEPALNSAQTESRNRWDIVFSIKPKYAEQILSGSKTVELRRRFPNKVASGSNALIYVTSPTRAMAGVASIERVVRDCPQSIWRNFSAKAGIDRAEYDSYFNGSEFAYAIILEDARPFDRSLKLDELRSRFDFEPPQSFLYAKAELRNALLHEFASLSN